METHSNVQIGPKVIQVGPEVECGSVRVDYFWSTLTFPVLLNINPKFQV